MSKLIIFLFVLAIIDIGLCQGTKFCSSFCSTGCSGDLFDNCNSKCNANWVASGQTCIPNAAGGWILHDTTPDVSGGTLGISYSSGITPTIDSTCNSMSYYGFIPSTTSMIISTIITTPYYQMAIYLSTISIDVNCWKKSCPGDYAQKWAMPRSYFVTFNDPLGTIANPTLSSQMKTKEYKCFINNFRQYYNRFSQQYTYSAVNTPLTWTISNDETLSSNLWGLREFIIIKRLCHFACLTCTGSSATMCSSCVQTPTMYWLSGTTCNQTCLTKYGMTSSPNICINCNATCTSCYQSPTNCSACTRSGTNTAYLYTPDPAVAYSQCLNPCPLGYFINKATFTCDLCNTNCSSCLNSANYCLSCKDISSGYTFGWANWICYDPCPIGYFINGANCTKCSPYCIVCEGSSLSCTSCTLGGTYRAFLYNLSGLIGSCQRTCPDGFYAETFNNTGPNLCLKCDLLCTKCTNNPIPCQECVAGYYLYLSTNCTNNCIAPTFAFINDLGKGICLDCTIYCVSLTINMYFPTSLNEQLYIDMIFSSTLDFNTFNMYDFQTITIESANIQYTLDMFDLQYSNISTSAYRIKIKPKSYIFLYNATFMVTTQAQPTFVHNSTSRMPFKVENYMKTAQTTWFLIKGPPFSDLQKSIMTSFATLSTTTNNILSSPYAQEFKKSGIFNLLFSGAQITSCSVLSNQITSQNLYEGVRIWAIFVFFDVPPYEKISNQTKRIISPLVQDFTRNTQQIDQKGIDNKKRELFSTNNMYWRFQRTGQTSFFIFDVYMPSFLILICWIGMIISYCGKNKKWYKPYSIKLYPIVHKLHQITIMYVTMASIVQFIYFEPSSLERFISAAICIIFNIYFIVYELFIYYEFIRYPLAEIGNQIYEYYVIRYGFFLKNIRFQQYDMNQYWSPKHWFRPYNYHILSYYKKFLMMISLPLFYDTQYAQMAILCFIQLLEIIRFLKTWPFLSNKRNFFRLSQQLSLFFFFMIHLIQKSVLNTIMKSDAQSLGSSVQMFYGVGWAGFALCFYFNVSHVIISIYDLLVSLKISNRAKMDNARKKYYYQKIKEYEKDNDASSKDLVNKWMILGNINDHKYDQSQWSNVRIQQYQIKKIKSNYELIIRKITHLQMKSTKHFKKKNYPAAGHKIQASIMLLSAYCSKLYQIIDEVYKQFQDSHVETIRLKTFLNVCQQDFKVGDLIPFDRNKMFQKIELFSYNNDKQQRQLQSILQGFPIDPVTIKNQL